MTTTQIIVVIVALLLAVLVFFFKGRKKTLNDQVKSIVDGANFKAESSSIFPKPEPIDSALYGKISGAYASDEGLRTLISEYFLKYDSVLLSSGLLTVHSDDDLIGVLWDNESTRDDKFRETPSSTEMRDHIKSDLSWFGTSASMVSLISANEVKFDSLKTTW